MENHFGGNSDSAEVMYVKLFQGIEGIYPKPPANSISLKETLSMPLIIKLSSGAWIGKFSWVLVVAPRFKLF